MVDIQKQYGFTPMLSPTSGSKLSRATVFYAYTISIGGVSVGTCEQFSEKSQRQVERIREIPRSQGQGPSPVDIVWGGSDVTLELQRVELYNKSLLNVFGAAGFLDFANTFLDVTESLFMPNDAKGKPQSPKVTTFKDCVVSNYSKQIQTSQARIMETMTVEVRYIQTYSALSTP